MPLRGCENGLIAAAPLEKVPQGGKNGGRDHEPDQDWRKILPRQEDGDRQQDRPRQQAEQAGMGRLDVIEQGLQEGLILHGVSFAEKVSRSG